MPPSGALADLDEELLVGRLRDGDEAAFRALVATHHRCMHHVASLYVQTRSDAEEVVQETWVAVLQGLDGFEGRSSFRTWLFRILVNRAKSRGVRERRTVTFSDLDSDAGPAVHPARFRDEANPWAGHWVVHPGRWSVLPEERLMADEVTEVARKAIRQLIPSQRTVIELRDVEGWTAAEVCAALEITAANQRVLLHRARSKVRRAIEHYLEEVDS